MLKMFWARRVCSAGCSEQRLLNSEGQSWQLGNMDQQTLEKDRKREKSALS